MKIIPSGKVLGASVEGPGLSRSLTEKDVETIVQALGRYGVLRFPRQRLTAAQQKAFAARFGELEINVASGAYQEPGIPEVMILSNIVKDGKPIGLADAGQDWHTDMSYSKTIAFANVLYALEVPRRNGKTLGDTEFSSMHAAYEGLPEDLKTKLQGMTVLHDFNKFWEMMRREKGSKRPPLTEAQRKAKPPVAHQLKPEYRYRHQWTEGDLLMWENFGTIHNATADYGPGEHRLVKRCQVMATRFAL